MWRSVSTAKVTPYDQWVWALAALGLLLAGCSALIALRSPASPNPALAAIVGSATVGILFGVGLFAWRRDPSNRFGPLLILGGFGSFVASLSASSDSLLYSVGRVSFWALQPLLIYLFLAYPGGHLTRRSERLVVGLAAGAVVVLYFPTALVQAAYPLLPAYCSASCPDNAFHVSPADFPLVQQVVIPLRELITMGLYAAAAWLTMNRLRRSSLEFRSLVPVFAAIIIRSVILSGYVLARALGAGARELTLFAWAALISVPVAALGFLAGLVQWRVYSAAVLEELALDPEEPSDPASLRARLARALEDPELVIYFPAGGSSRGWRDHTGRDVPPPVEDGRCLVAVDDGEERLAVVACNPALAAQRSVVEASASWLRASLVRHRLRAELGASLHSVEESRRRLAAAVALERRKIEQDLHDGAQQQLVILRIRMALLAEEMEKHPEHGAEKLRELAPSVDSMIDELRSIARGIYPPLLADAGLGEALRAVARSSRGVAAVTAAIDDDLGRFPLEVESAVYFCCLEAIQNATKHANATHLVVHVGATERTLHFAVSDDGQGFTPDRAVGVDVVRGGSGMGNMQDRVAALGGSLTVRSKPGGGGTVVKGELPIPER